MSTGIKELDRVLGGGIVAGSLVLVGGDPGIGKSTLLLTECAGFWPAWIRNVLYISGEESLDADQTSVRSVSGHVCGRSCCFYVRRIWRS